MVISYSHHRKLKEGVNYLEKGRGPGKTGGGGRGQAPHPVQVSSRAVLA